MVMTPTPETRRAFPRRRLNNVEMFCYRASPSVTPQFRRNIGSEIVDISPGGARLRVSEPVGRGETVTLELRDRSSGESFRARGEVRWSTSATSGVVLGVQFSEHYTPVGTRESFTGTAATGVKTPAAPAAPESDDIVLAPQEKRSAVRFALHDYVITVYRQGALASQGLKKNVGRQVLDISQTGVQLEISESLEAGSLIQFTLHLNALSDSLDALAAVRWCRPDPATAGGGYRCGLQFLNLGDAQRKKIEFMRKWFTRPKKK
ncbi:MAG TPA: PilZ domain-containing protein [Planctomycetota bacterium]|nr:PilZ domain-containing protein [Planctomycetota bacterium]